jgi:hypothetical protein
MKIRRIKNLMAGIVGGCLVLGISAASTVVRAAQVAGGQDEDATPAPGVRYSPGVADLLKLVDAKVDAEVIKAYIKNSSTVFNPSAAEVVALKNRGVPDVVLTALLQRAAEVRKQLALMYQVPGRAENANQRPVEPPAYPANNPGYAVNNSYTVAPSSPNYGYGVYPVAYGYGYPYVGYGYNPPYYYYPPYGLGTLMYNSVPLSGYGNYGRAPRFRGNNLNNFAGVNFGSFNSVGRVNNVNVGGFSAARTQPFAPAFGGVANRNVSTQPFAPAFGGVANRNVSTQPFAPAFGGLGNRSLGSQPFAPAFRGGGGAVGGRPLGAAGGRR